MWATSKPSRACKFIAGVMLVFIGTVACPVPAQTAAGSTLYQLNKDSSFEQGCFGPCLCAVMFDAPVSGTVLLVPLGTDPLFNTYLVTNVNWNVPIDGTNMIVTGSGTYKIGGEVAVQQQLLLDLQLGGGNVNHFDSGLVAASAPFPQIVTTISTNHQY